MKELHERGIPGFLIYPATLKVTVEGAQRTFSSAQEAARFLEEEFVERGRQPGTGRTARAQNNEKPDRGQNNATG